MEGERRSLGKKVANCASLVGVGQQPQGREWVGCTKNVRDAVGCVLCTVPAVPARLVCSLKVALPFRSHPNPREGSKDSATLYGSTASEQEEHRAEADGKRWLLSRQEAARSTVCVLHGGTIPSREAEVDAGWSQVPGPL